MLLLDALSIFADFLRILFNFLFKRGDFLTDRLVEHFDLRILLVYVVDDRLAFLLSIFRLISHFFHHLGRVLDLLIERLHDVLQLSKVELEDLAEVRHRRRLRRYRFLAVSAGCSFEIVRVIFI